MINSMWYPAVALIHPAHIPIRTFEITNPIPPIPRTQKKKKPTMVRLIGSRRCESSSGESNSLVGSVKDRVEPLKEGVTVDEIEPPTAGGSKIGDYEVNVAGRAANKRVERTGKQLSICCEGIRDLFHLRELWIALRATEKPTPFVVKYRLCSFAYWAGVMLRRPVVLSRTAPVADVYLLKASLAIRIRVVPDIKTRHM
jgi:hypothetical protein